jgi:hypothetical protein
MMTYSYSNGNIFWLMLEFFLFFLWIWLAISVFADIFRSHDLSGSTKALWVIFVVVLPFFGVFAYLIFRGNAMHERAAAQVGLQRHAFNGYFQHASGSLNVADQLHKLADLKERGFITDTEFQVEKEKLLSEDGLSRRTS